MSPVPAQMWARGGEARVATSHSTGRIALLAGISVHSGSSTRIEGLMSTWACTPRAPPRVLESKLARRRRNDEKGGGAQPSPGPGAGVGGRTSISLGAASIRSALSVRACAPTVRGVPLEYAVSTSAHQPVLERGRESEGIVSAGMRRLLHAKWDSC